MSGVNINEWYYNLDGSPLPTVEGSLPDVMPSKDIKDDKSCSFINKNRTTTQVQLITNPSKRLDDYCTCSKYAVMHKVEKFYIPLPCKKWTCPDCGKKLARNLQKRLEQSEANEWPIKTHITLTVHSVAESAIIDEAFNDLLTFLRRGGRFEYTTFKGIKQTVTLPVRSNLKYIKVKEFQTERMAKTGDIVLHIHVVFNQYLTKYDLIPIWQHALKLHGSKNSFNYVEDTHPHNFNAGKYLAKYFTKEEYQELFAKGERRYSCSKGVVPPIPKKIPTGEWDFMSISKARLIVEYLNTTDKTDKQHLLSRLMQYEDFDETMLKYIPTGFDGTMVIEHGEQSRFNKEYFNFIE